MAEQINLNRFKNKNLPPIKDVVKTTAAVTLLLSTAACNSSQIKLINIPLVVIAWAVGLTCMFYRRRGGGSGGNASGGNTPHTPTQ